MDATATVFKKPLGGQTTRVPMATAEQVKALLRSFADGDADHVYSVALQIAAQAAHSGKAKIARELRDLVDELKGKRATGQIAVPMARPSGELAGLLAVAYPKTTLADMVISAEVKEHLERVLHEYRNQHLLRERALSPRRKLLLVGPPGCGKTMSAHALAGELKLPLFSVQLHSLITKYMGETAAKLHLVFDAMQQVRGVYLFDEFDAIGAHRGAANDVGEIRRVLNSFLKFLELEDSESLVIAATNYVDMLDEALFRRFDDVVRYERPTRDEAMQLIQNRLTMFGLDVPWEPVLNVAAGLTHAEIARACNDAAKESVLARREGIDAEQLIAFLKSRHRKTKG